MWPLNQGWKVAAMSQFTRRRRSFFTSANIQAEWEWHQFRGDTKEYQRAVNTVQLHSQGKEKCKVNNAVSTQCAQTRQNKPNFICARVRPSCRRGKEGAYSVIQPSAADRSRHFVRRGFKKDTLTGKVNYGWSRGKKEKTGINVEEYLKKWRFPSEVTTPAPPTPRVNPICWEG